MANYTYTTSKANFDPTTWRTGTARLQRTTPNEFNLKLTHDRGRVSPRGAVTYNAAAIRAYQYADGHPGGSERTPRRYPLYPSRKLSGDPIANGRSTSLTAPIRQRDS